VGEVTEHSFSGKEETPLDVPAVMCFIMSLNVNYCALVTELCSLDYFNNENFAIDNFLPNPPFRNTTEVCLNCVGEH
jgi:hypothetical protein